MNLKTLDIVRTQLLQSKAIAEANIEHMIMDKELNPENKVSNIIVELDKLKNASLNLSYWEEFINNNIITPNKREEKQKK